MAGAVKVDDKKAMQRLADMSARSGDPARFMAGASFQMHGDIINHFDQQSGPTGRWRSWSPKYTERMEKAGKGGNMILVDRGIMRGGIRPSSGRNTAIVQTSPVTPYAVAHDSGSAKRGIPKREFMWLTPKLVRNIADGFARFVVGT